MFIRLSRVRGFGSRKNENVAKFNFNAIKLHRHQFDIIQSPGQTVKLIVSKAQYSALMAIYGPPENVHYMIMCSLPKDGKFSLEGEKEDFEDLLSVISEDIGEGFCSKTNAGHLLAVCKKIDPSSLDWIGM